MSSQPTSNSQNGFYKDKNDIIVLDSMPMEKDTKLYNVQIENDHPNDPQKFVILEPTKFGKFIQNSNTQRILKAVIALAFLALAMFTVVKLYELSKPATEDVPHDVQKAEKPADFTHLPKTSHEQISNDFVPAISQQQQISVDPNERVDCAPRPGDSKNDCIARGCIWDEYFDKYHPSVPLCYFPSNVGYTVKSHFKGRVHLSSSKAVQNPYDKNFDELDVTYRSMGSALAVRIGTSDRWVPPCPFNFDAKIASESEKLVFAVRSSPIFSFAVKRASDGVSIWDTSIGGLMFGDKYIQIATYLPTDRIYGFGENSHQQLKHDFSGYKSWSMFTRDEGPNAYDANSANYYGTHAFYLGLEASGKAHGVFIFNSNAQEITTGPAPHLVYRTIGGQLDIFFFPGPSPEDVIRQYHQLIGTPFLPAYWALGFQMCRWGYKDLEHLKTVVKRTQDAGIPFDVAYSDIDYMDRFMDFTYDTEKWGGFAEYIEELHDKGMKLILIFDPPLQVNYSAFERALEEGASFIEWPRDDMVMREVNDLYPLTNGTKLMLGSMWPFYHVAYPDWLDPTGKTTKWWINEFVRFREILPFDGIWIDMNEPSNFQTNEVFKQMNLNADAAMGFNEEEATSNKTDDQSIYKDKPVITPLRCPLTGPDSQFDNPSYKTLGVYQWGKKSALSEKTLCMCGETMRGKANLYNTHNLYGWSQSVATMQAQHKSTGKRGAIISRSTFPSSGHYGGHWLGDNRSRWPDLQYSIIGAMEFNMFGITYNGADVCGFGDPTNEELCLRWQQLGAFHSFYRNHNALNNPDQDPGVWKSVAVATREANLFRYQHLPFLYSLHFRNTQFGGTVVRPLFFEFPNDVITHTLSYQFMWGSSMVIIPVITANVDVVRGYLPYNETWYSISQAHNFAARVPSGYSTFFAPRDTPLPVFLRAGHLIPKQRPGLTITETRKNEFQLIAALASNSLSASGEMFWDDGESIIEGYETHPYYHFEYSVTANESQIVLVINSTHFPEEKDKLVLPSLDLIEILGQPFAPTLESATLNGQPVEIDLTKSSYDSEKQYLRIEGSGLINLNKNGPIWTLILPVKQDQNNNSVNTIQSNSISRVA